MARHIERAAVLLGAVPPLLFLVASAFALAKDDPGDVTLLAFATAPFALALVAAFMPRLQRRPRATLLGVATITSLIAALGSVSVLALPFPPLLGGATLLAELGPRGAERVSRAPALLVLVAMVVIWLAGVIVVLSGPDVTRCVTTVRYADGTTNRTIRRYEGPGASGYGSSGGNVLSSSSSCISDWVTGAEWVPALGLLVLYAGLAGMTLRSGRDPRTMHSAA